jgi:hypothetical protein
MALPAFSHVLKVPASDDLGQKSSACVRLTDPTRNLNMFIKDDGAEEMTHVKADTESDKASLNASATMLRTRTRSRRLTSISTPKFTIRETISLRKLADIESFFGVVLNEISFLWNRVEKMTFTEKMMSKALSGVSTAINVATSLFI